MVSSVIMDTDILTLTFHRLSRTTVLSGNQCRVEDHQFAQEASRSEVGGNLPILRDQANHQDRDRLKQLKSKLGYSNGAHKRR